MLLRVAVLLSAVLFTTECLLAQVCRNCIKAPSAVFMHYVPPPAPSVEPVVVENMLGLAQVKPTDVVYDFEADDASVLIAAAQNYKCRAVGLVKTEYSKQLAEQKIQAAGCQSLASVKLLNAESLATMQQEASIVTVHARRRVLIDAVVNVLPRLRRGSRAVSYRYRIPLARVERNTCRVGQVEHEYYVWRARLRVPIIR